MWENNGDETTRAIAGSSKTGFPVDARIQELIEIIGKIGREEGVPSADLACRLGVGERTVRTYVRQANELIAPSARIVKRRGGGYVLEVENVTSLAEKGCDAHQARLESAPRTREERVSYLVNDLVSRSDWVTLGDLESTLCASRSAISLDLKEVERTLDKFDLTLERRPWHGLRVQGDELNRRLCIAASIARTELIAAPGTPPTDGIANRLIGMEGIHDQRVLLEDIVESIGNLLATIDYSINAIAYQNLLIHIIVAVFRIAEGHYAPMERSDLEGLKNTEAFAASRTIAEGIRDRIGIELPEEEIAYISIHLAGKRAYYENPRGETTISDEVWDLTERMVCAIWETFRFDFRGDLELRMNLARHIEPLSIRLQHHMELKNPLLGEIKTRYPLGWSMATEAGAVLAHHFGTQLSEDETGYLALAFALAIEREHEDAPKKNLLVVCASGTGSARLLEHRCTREFGDIINEIRTCDILHISSVDFSDIDYVFTTVPLDRALPVPVREISLFLEKSEVENLRNTLETETEPDDALRCLDRSLFFPHLPCSSKDEALDYLCMQLRTSNALPRDFEELVRKREAAAPTCFGNGVALPHPLEAVSDRTEIAIGLLDNPVAWDPQGTPVQAVLLISPARSADKETQGLFRLLADYLIDTQAIGRLLADRTWDSLFQGLLDTQKTKRSKKPR